MKKILSALFVLGLLVISGCAGRGSFFEWGDSAQRVTTYETRAVSPCGG